jgi:hypothetical protein
MEVSDQIDTQTALPVVPTGLEAGWVPEPV